MVNVIAIPERFKDGVTEPEHQHILNSLFAEVMIDAVDLVFAKRLMYRFVQCSALARSVPNGFSITTRRRPLLRC